ncbi:MAG: stage III sporulation protein AB [Clostridia bacterium]|nr:stage III sporulation protein AB [Clostridia bacterium]
MLSLRLVISILLVIACSMIGIIKSRSFENREHILRESIFLFKGIENEIKFSLTTIPNAIEVVRQRMNTYLKDVLGSISLILLEANATDEKILNELDKLTSLTTYDKQIILTGITSLGTSDIAGEEGIINITISSLENELNDAIESKKKNSKMYKTVGLATGLIIAIILV